MAFVAVAIGGAAVIGGIASVLTGKAAGKAAQQGADAAAAATIESTRMQIEEIRRQFDYQQQILLPQIQSQYNAQGAFSDLLGIGGNRTSGAVPATGSGAPSNLPVARGGPGGSYGYGAGPDNQRLINGPSRGSTRGGGGYGPMTPPINGEMPQYPDSGSTRFQRGAGGQFIDPNLDPTRLADVNTLGDTVRGNLQAGTDAADDPYRNYISGNRFAAETAGQDARVSRARDVTLGGMRAGASLMDERGNVLLTDQRGNENIADGAAGTGVYGETFEASPGYAFAREEMDRASDRVRSAGGNYGGRAVIESQRRAKGLADQDYYNWAAGRTSDLRRRGDAEAADIGRRDQFAGYDISRGDQFTATDIARGDDFARTDLNRGDVALSGYESQRIADVGRGDQAYQDYLRRREGDAGRLDAAAGQEDALIASDRAREDQSYYNYLANLSRVAGFGGGPAATAVNASQVAGNAVTGAYAREGGNLSSIYSNLGTDRANIANQVGSGINNSLISGIENFVTYQNAA